MPSSMIHLLVGKEIKEQAPTLFYIGCLAPDCIEEREFKDSHHFRDRNDRIEALQQLKEKIDLSDPYQFGILLHLFTDLKWDEATTRDFREYFFKDDIFEFLKYRKEIGVAGNYLFHICPWSSTLWREMDEFSVEKYPTIYDLPPESIHAFITRQYKWHSENDTGAPSIFTPAFVKGFVVKTVEEFYTWNGK